MSDKAPEQICLEKVLEIIETRKRCEYIPGKGLPDGRVHTITALLGVEKQVRALLSKITPQP